MEAALTSLYMFIDKFSDIINMMQLPALDIPVVFKCSHECFQDLNFAIIGPSYHI